LTNFESILLGQNIKTSHDLLHHFNRQLIKNSRACLKSKKYNQSKGKLVSLMYNYNFVNNNFKK